MRVFTAIKNRFFKWIDKRLPAQVEIELRQKNIYILPTRYGWLLLAIILLILIAATNYQNNMGYMAGFILLAIGALSTFYTYRNLRHLKIKSLKPEPVFVGQKAQLVLSLTNQTDQYRASVGLGQNKQQLALLDIASQDSSLHKMTFRTKQRGWFKPPRMVCSSVFPFGIFQVWSWFKSPYQILLYPKPLVPPVALFQGAQGDEEGSQSQKGSEDFYSIKEYQHGDSLKQVMWKAYARERGLLTKEFEDKVGEQQLFTWQSVAHYEKELALSYLCYELIEADKKGIDYGLQLPKQTFELSRGAKHLHQCLEALALF
ncbi:DUF58 domain-containing protein [Kangiella sp. TOML190]|uniref:DUF58 domain-containing protein n=1 Tax=Kangiella sp. TOML190 TaxID=2931351 RepID=UPI0020415656|nr:DUF58 domain-containing protein [Kangiella sp. TOML190]